MAEFSVPLKDKPIPLASVKVYFYYDHLAIDQT